mgnify:CR=1 FL=1
MRDNVPVIGSVHAASDARPVHRLINELTGTRLRPQNDVHTFVTGRRSIVGALAQTSFVCYRFFVISAIRRRVIVLLSRRPRTRFAIGLRHVGIESNRSKAK